MKRNHRHPSLVGLIFPFHAWLKEYRLSYLRSDLVAGLTVSVVLIPQAMAYAILAGLPPIYGLYAAAVTPAIAALWGSLRQLATGPIAIMSLLVLTTLATLAEPGTPEFVELSLLLALMTGIIYLVIGIFRLGIVMNFVSHSAVKGFTSAAAIIISATQLPQLLGLNVSRHEFVFPMLADIAKNLPDLHALTAALGISAFVVIHFSKKYRPAFPIGLPVLAVAALAVYAFGLDVAVIGQIPAGLPSFRLPHTDFKTVSELIGPAFVIALVSFAETYSVGKAISAETKQHVDVNQEFVGQGMANLVGAFFQSYPVSGSFSRTAINHASGAKTGIAGIVSSLSVILALLFLTPFLTGIPKAALAALVISAVLTLFHPKDVFSLWKMNRHDGVVAITVFALALLTKPDYALLMGVIISLMLFLWKTMHPRIVRVAKDSAHGMFVNADLFDKPSCPQILHLRSDNVIYFANADYTIEHIIQQLDDNDTQPIKFLLLDFQAVGFIDITGIDEMRMLNDELKRRGIEPAIVSAHLPVKQTFEKTGFSHELKPGHLMENLNEAVSFLFKSIDHDYCKNVCPYDLFHECPTEKNEHLRGR